MQNPLSGLAATRLAAEPSRPTEYRPKPASGKAYLAIAAAYVIVPAIGTAVTNVQPEPLALNSACDGRAIPVGGS